MFTITNKSHHHFSAAEAARIRDYISSELPEPVQSITECEITETEVSVTTDKEKRTFRLVDIFPTHGISAEETGLSWGE